MFGEASMIKNTIKLSFFALLLSLLTPPVIAERFYVVVGLAKPPYVIQETNSGFEIELISSILKKMGKQPDFIYVPFGRSLRMLNNERIDAIMTINTNLINDISRLSDPYITYQNVAITLKSDNLVLNNVTDLSQYSIAAFQTADKVLGKSYAQAITKNEHYTEVADQRHQTKLLFDKKVQALVMDINIFNALSPLVGGEEDHSDVNIHLVFPKSPYRMAFKNKKPIEPFNHALRDFKDSPAYQALINKYNLQKQPLFSDEK